MPPDLNLLKSVLQKKVASEPLRNALWELVSDSAFKGVIGEEEVLKLAAVGKLPGEKMLLVLAEVSQVYAVPTISNFHVGAIAQGASSKSFYMGANMEFAGQALSFTLHAEQAATTNAWTNDEEGLLLLAVNAAPCGYCRQFLNELMTAKKLMVALEGSPAEPLAKFLPKPFGPEELGVKEAEAMMSTQHHNLKLAEESTDLAVRAALAAANQCYAPMSYTDPPHPCYAGVAIETAKQIFTGRLGENVAYNPSISPLEAAMTMWTFGAAADEPVLRVVLVQVEGTIADQTTATEAVLGTLPGPPTFEQYWAVPAS